MVYRKDTLENLLNGEESREITISASRLTIRIVIYDPFPFKLVASSVFY